MSSSGSVGTGEDGGPLLPVSLWVLLLNQEREVGLAPDLGYEHRLSSKLGLGFFE